MEDSTITHLGAVLKEYIPYTTLNEYQLRCIASNLKGRTPEALASMLVRTAPLYALEKFLFNYIKREKFWQEFDEYWDSLKLQAEINSALDVDNFKALLDTGIPPLDIITKHVNDISPLYRYLMALMMGFYGEVKNLEPLACRQLRENPFYFDHYIEHAANFPLTKAEVYNAKN
jgi:hypothetical protein